MFRSIAILLLTLLLVSCAGKPDFDVRKQIPAVETLTIINEPIGEPIVIAVYDFLDMTGQKKPGGNFASMSTAVTQGAYQILIKALQDAGDGSWFRVVERASLPSLLQERKLIRSTRQQVDGDKAEPLPPLLFAGAYLTGGIIGYDSDVKTGGYGARILGLQAHKQWRQDVVTVILRLVNVQTGEVVISIVVEKTIISGETGGDVFKYFDADTLLLELEVGVARNEPVTFAVRKAIEKGIVELIKEGDEKGVWKMKVEEVTSGFENSEDIPDKVVIEQQEPKKVKTYEDYLLQKEADKEKRKLEIQAKLLKEKELEKENTNEEINDGTSDSSSNND
jgi:curli production assembly/transport component CsgG